ncbi:hypothetical protein E4U43_006667 [Claviceps pusilla]|uniref:Secondary alcohol dehydrogenase n=1 Tax=Claviceps pusilla TaxID=123648 RepID=A0A9P7SSQ7_9HYPO|nr:hypothetical protein E4U43_006667 [Claviceps pusilla]
MSADTRPISPSRFAAALKDLSLSMLHLKVLEIRNSIAHLQYSNDQLRPFADGTATALGAEQGQPAQPDQDCVDAMRENEVVMERMAERIALVRTEVEGRGVSWAEFRSQEEVEADKEADKEADRETARAQRAESPLRNGGQHPGDGDTERAHSAWTDGTFQTGTIRNGELHMDGRSGVSQTGTGTHGGRLSDDELRRAMEERMRNLENEEEEGGMHL